MTEATDSDQVSKVAYVVDLATRLADRILNARFSGRAIEPEQIGALVQSARLMQELGVPWPPLVEQALHEFANGLNGQSTPDLTEQETVGDKGMPGLSRFLGAFRREKGAPA